MRGLQAILTGLVLLGGIGMLLAMLGWVPGLGIASALVVVASFAFMAYGDMKASAKRRDAEGPGEPI